MRRSSKTAAPVPESTVPNPAAPAILDDEGPVEYAPLEVRGQADDATQRSRYGNPKHQVFIRHSAALDYAALRAQSRAIYSQSSLAAGIVQRFVDVVVNTGPRWESSPVWDFLPDAPEDPEVRRRWTQRVERLIHFVMSSRDLDFTGQQTGYELLRTVQRLMFSDGEVFAICRYLGGRNRLTPLALQIIDPDQVVTPYGPELSVVERAGGKILDGVEFNASGQAVAVWVASDLARTSIKRIPYYSSDGSRRFVIHWAHREVAGQVRGISELNGAAYDQNRLEEYKIGELEAAVTNAAILMTVESDVAAQPGKGLNISRLGRVVQGPKPGIETVRLNGKSIVINNLHPGYRAKPWTPNRPNSNYANFVESHESNVTSLYGMPYSCYRMKFDSSFSASRGEVHFFFYNVDSRLAEMAAFFLDPIKDIILAEEYAAGRLAMPGYDAGPLERRAWLNGTWNGVARPSFDPVREARGAKLRQDMNHTTAEREAAAYNGSSHAENAQKRSDEKALEKSLGLSAPESAPPASYPGEDPEDEDDTDNPDSPDNPEGA